MRYGQIAQSVEQRTENPRVGGSIPSLATILRQPLMFMSRFGHVGVSQGAKSKTCPSTTSGPQSISQTSIRFGVRSTENPQ